MQDFLKGAFLEHAPQVVVVLTVHLVSDSEYELQSALTQVLDLSWTPEADDAQLLQGPQ